MGQSTDAYLFYGVCFDVEGEGDIYKADGYCDDEDEDDDVDVDVESWEYRYRRLTGDDPSNAACEIGVHCSNDYRMPFIAIQNTTRIASRGYPEIINGLPFDDSWPAQVEEFCRKMGIVAKPDGPPGWRLASWWG